MRALAQNGTHGWDLSNSPIHALRLLEDGSFRAIGILDIPKSVFQADRNYQNSRIAFRCHRTGLIEHRSSKSNEGDPWPPTHELPPHHQITLTPEMLVTRPFAKPSAHDVRVIKARPHLHTHP